MGGGDGATNRFAIALTVALGLAILSLLSALVYARSGNLAWDDADYLRRGLANARFAAAAGPLAVLPRAIDRLLLEQPKPPWFVAWIELGVHAIGRRSIGVLIQFSTVVPYCLLMFAVVLVGRRMGGAWGGFFSLACLAASPLSLAFGGKVMVETFLAVWVLLVYCLTALYVTAPSRKVAAALGLAVGLALLTKLTTFLFLPGPFVYACVRSIRDRAGAAIFLKRLALSVAVCLAVAGPWYARNGGRAVKFAFFSSRYNEVATGNDRVATAHRAAEIARDVAGWPLTVTIAAGVLAVATLGRGKPLEAAAEAASLRQGLARACFTKMAWLGAGIAAAALLYPAYFDTRFLLPIWPVLAVAIGSNMRSRVVRLPPMPKILLEVGLAASVLLAVANVAREPLFATYWGTTGLIDDLVKRYGVSNVLNVGNCAAWNVCKTGLMNELRDDPGNCFVLHDLTRGSDDRANQLLDQADAVLVLGRSDLSDSVLQLAPGLNRGYGAAVENLARNTNFRQVALPATAGLPELFVFVRQAAIPEAQEMSNSQTRKRR
jgi:4-amino-4-deoxy-L-arabinose transferase-like glycosyltransferase